MESKWHNAPRCCIKEIFHPLLSWAHGGILLLKTFSSEVVFFTGKWNVRCFSPWFWSTGRWCAVFCKDMLLIYFCQGKQQLYGKFWDLQIKRKYCKCMQSLLRVRINSQVSTKPYIRVQHSMDQLQSCSSTKLFQQGKPSRSQKKGCTGCVLTICIKYRITNGISKSFLTSSVLLYYNLVMVHCHTGMTFLCRSAWYLKRKNCIKTELIWAILLNQIAAHNEILCRM